MVFSLQKYLELIICHISNDLIIFANYESDSHQ